MTRETRLENLSKKEADNAFENAGIYGGADLIGIRTENNDDGTQDVVIVTKK